MKQRLRIYYTESQKASMWERWRKGESLQDMAQRPLDEHLYASRNRVEWSFCRIKLFRRVDTRQV